jgi:hypothetical protein
MIALAIAAAAAAAIAAFLILRKRKAAAPSAPANPMDPTAWEIGPIINGVNSSAGVPVHPAPHPDGWAFDIPQPTAEAGHVHYLTFRHGPLAGKSRIVLRCRVEADAGVRIVPRRFPDSPSLLTLYFQRRDDDWSGQGRYEAFRWWATFATVMPVAPGEYEIVAPLDGKWTAVMTSSAESNPAGFQAAVADADRVGFVLGGGDGYGHGVYATGPARFVVTGFEIQ